MRKGEKLSKEKIQLQLTIFNKGKTWDIKYELYNYHNDISRKANTSSITARLMLAGVMIA